MRSLDEKRELMRMEHNQTTIYRGERGKTIVQRDDKGASPNSLKAAWKCAGAQAGAETSYRMPDLRDRANDTKNMMTK